MKPVRHTIEHVSGHEMADGGAGRSAPTCGPYAAETHSLAVSTPIKAINDLMADSAEG